MSSAASLRVSRRGSPIPQPNYLKQRLHQYTFMKQAQPKDKIILSHQAPDLQNQFIKLIVTNSSYLGYETQMNNNSPGKPAIVNMNQPNDHDPIVRLNEIKIRTNSRTRRNVKSAHQVSRFHSSQQSTSRD